MIRRALIAMLFAPVVGAAEAQVAQVGEASFQPLFVVYSTGASTAEGDPDYRQIVYIALDADGPARHLWVYDPDTAGAHDSAFAPGETSRTAMRVLGGPDAFRGPVDPETEAAMLDTGLIVAERIFGDGAETDGRWVRLARLEPARGAAFGRERVFRFQAVGLEGVEGNVFDLRLGDASGPDLAPSPPGARLFAYDLSLRAATPETVIETRFAPPPDAAALVIRNFDSGGGVLTLEAPFRTEPLQTSGNDLWTEDRVALRVTEPGSPAAVRFFGGRETPNDLSLTLRAEAADGSTRRLAVSPPIRLEERNARPKAEALWSPVGCRAVRLDGTLSQDEEGAALGYRWVLPDGRVRTTPVALVRLPGAGTHSLRLEVDDGSGGSSARHALGVEVSLRDPPAAVIDLAPEVVAPGEAVRLSAARSSPGAGAPDAAELARFLWSVGGETREGRSTDVQLTAPGAHEIGLEVVAAGEHPCRVGTATARVRVNAPPVAEAGPDRRAVAGAPVVLDAGESHDPDGVIRAFLWEFGDGRRAVGPRATVRYDSPGARVVTLTVIDDSGVANAVVRDRVTVTVTSPPNAPPVARIDAPEAVLTGLPVVFGSARSGDPDGRLLTRRWRFGDSADDVGPSAVRTFFAPGSVAVAFEARDATGRLDGRASARAAVDVAAPPNLAPIAVAGPDRVAEVGERLVFDAGRSRDPDGAILDWRWRFEPGVEARGPVAVHAFQRPGRYEVRLDVADDAAPERGRATAVTIVTVRPPAQPASRP